MVNLVESLLGITLGSAVAALFYYIRYRGGGERAEKHRTMMRRALLFTGVAGGLTVIGEILIRM
jgi:hypothetical protein